MRLERNKIRKSAHPAEQSSSCNDVDRRTGATLPKKTSCATLAANSSVIWGMSDESASYSFKIPAWGGLNKLFSEKQLRGDANASRWKRRAENG
jgi:hypothetical protein